MAAAKVAGYTAAGWSLGVLNAVTDAATARFVDSADVQPHAMRVEPRTSYSVARLSRNFHDGASAIGGLVTAVNRFGDGAAWDGVLPHSAYAAGLDGRHRFDDAMYELTGFVIGSRLAGTPASIAHVLDGPGHYLHADTSRRTATGAAGELHLARIGGDHWRWSLAAHAISPRFDVNDAGFQHSADWLLLVGTLSYSDFRPHGLFNRWTIGSNQIGKGWSVGGLHRANVVNVTASGELRNYTDFSVSVDHELPAVSTDLLRDGPALLMPTRDNIVLSVSSDLRRTTGVTLTDTTIVEPATHSLAYAIAPLVDIRASDRARLAIGPELAHVVNGWQFVSGAGGRYVLARLRQQTASLSVHGTYAFSPTVTFELYANPFVSANRYDAFKAVRAPRAARVADRAPLLPADSIAFPDPSFTTRQLNVNAVLRWEFRPGSTLFLVWTQQRSGSVDDVGFGLGRVASGAFQPPPTNTVLIKVSYWLGR